MKRLTQKQITDLVIDAYTHGANDASDIYLYVSQYGNVTFEDIAGITTSLFGPLNLTPASPSNYLLN